VIVCLLIATGECMLQGKKPEMHLENILGHFCKTKFCIENVKSYYEPFIKPQAIGRHYFWANFNMLPYAGKFLSVGRFGPTKKGRTDVKKQVLRNCVEPET
jgi:hypothetical protein